MKKEYVRLRRWRIGDLTGLHVILSTEKDISYWCGFPFPKDKDDTRNYLADLCQRKYWYCIEYGNEIAGSISLTDKSGGDWELGYWLRKRFRHKGIMQEAIRQVKEKAFGELSAKRILCGWFDGNNASRRCQERSGFIYMKTIRVATAQGVRTEHCSSCLL